MSKTILFVEDESALQKAVGEILQQEGYTLLTALNGEDGIKLAQKHHPDLILLDLIIPKKDGFEVLQTLKGNDETKDIPVIILTNLETTQDIGKALDLGATTYLVKANYKLEEVLQKVKETLEK